MSKYSSQSTFVPVSNSSNAPTVKADNSKLVLRYVLGGVVSWLIGIQFMTGWHLATQGNLNYAKSVVAGAYFILFALVGSILFRRARIHSGGIGLGIALAFGFIFIEASFPIGALTGSIWNSIGGTFPDMSRLGNHASFIIGVQALSTFVT